MAEDARERHDRRVAALESILEVKIVLADLQEVLRTHGAILSAQGYESRIGGIKENVAQCLASLSEIEVMVTLDGQSEKGLAHESSHGDPAFP